MAADTQPISPVRRWPWLVTLAWAALAAAPVVAMVVEVLRSPRLHFLDYWQIFSFATTDSGALDLPGLFTLHNGHPIVTPGLLFWLDGQLSGGSNIVVGLVDVVLAAAAVLALRGMLPADLEPTKKAALTVAFSFLLFSPGALEMFGMGMSGASWLLGLVPAVFAMLCAHRGHTVAALALALLASLGHGTAFALWPALALVAWLRGDAWWRVLAPLVAVVGVVVGWLALPGPAEVAGPGGEYGLDSRLAAMAGALSPLRTADGSPFALAAGGAIVVVIVAFGLLAVRERLAEPAARSDAGWVGLGTHMLGAAAMIGLSRVDYGPTIGLSTRYATLSGLATCVVLALVVLRKPALPRVRVAAGVCALAAATFVAGSLEAVTVRNQYPGQQLLEVAMRVGADDVVASYRIDPDFAELAERAGIYPFSGDLDLGCGIRLGERLDEIDTLPDGQGFVDSGPVRGGVEIKGWAVVNDHRTDCVFVVDGSDTVVGGGHTGVARPDVPSAAHTFEQRAGWVAVADPSTTDGTAVVSSGGDFYRLPSPATP
jgi:hypothetical protein